MRRAYCQLTLITRNNATDAGDVSGSAPGRKQTPAVGTQRVTKDDVRPDCSAYLFNSFSGISLFFYFFLFIYFILFFLFWAVFLFLLVLYRGPDIKWPIKHRSALRRPLTSPAAFKKSTVFNNFYQMN